MLKWHMGDAVEAAATLQDAREKEVRIAQLQKLKVDVGAIRGLSIT